MEAFETEDKAVIAKKLGYSSNQAIYKVISGDRELDFEKLRKFQFYTKCTIDWLLTGQGSKYVAGVRDFDIELAIEKHNSWQPILEDWYEFEGQEMPQLTGASFMHGWDSFPREVKIAAIQDLKKVLDTHI